MEQVISFFTKSTTFYAERYTDVPDTNS